MDNPITGYNALLSLCTKVLYGKQPDIDMHLCHYFSACTEQFWERKSSEKAWTCISNFEHHDGDAVSCDDFLSAMGDANGVDLSQFALW